MSDDGFKMPRAPRRRQIDIDAARQEKNRWKVRALELKAELDDMAEVAYQGHEREKRLEAELDRLRKIEAAAREMVEARKRVEDGQVPRGVFWEEYDALAETLEVSSDA